MIRYIYLGLLIVVGLMTFFVYGWDKFQAKRGGRRVAESTLHLLALAGGWIGAILGQQVFRHKTQKSGFRWITWLITALHILGMVLVAIRYNESLF